MSPQDLLSERPTRRRQGEWLGCLPGKRSVSAVSRQEGREGGDGTSRGGRVSDAHRQLPPCLAPGQSPVPSPPLCELDPSRRRLATETPNSAHAIQRLCKIVISPALQILMATM